MEIPENHKSTNLALNSDVIEAIDKHLEDIPIAKKKVKN